MFYGFAYFFSFFFQAKSVPFEWKRKTLFSNGTAKMVTNFFY